MALFHNKCHRAPSKEDDEAFKELVEEAQVSQGGLLSDQIFKQHEHKAHHPRKWSPTSSAEVNQGGALIR